MQSEIERKGFSSLSALSDQNGFILLASVNHFQITFICIASLNNGSRKIKGKFYKPY